MYCVRFRRAVLAKKECNNDASYVGIGYCQLFRQRCDIDTTVSWNLLSQSFDYRERLPKNKFKIRMKYRIYS